MSSIPIGNLDWLHPADVRVLFNRYYDSICGTIRWKKTYGHPKMTVEEVRLAPAHGGAAASYAVGVQVHAFQYGPDPTSTTRNVKDPIQFLVGDTPKCWAGADDPVYHQLSYRIDRIPFDKETTVTVSPALGREWVPGTDPASVTGRRKFMPAEPKVTLKDKQFSEDRAFIDFEMTLDA